MQIVKEIGQITVIKTLIISLFNHLFMALPNPPASMIIELNKIIYDFIWNGTPRIKASVLVKPYEEGGLKMINISAFIAALKLTWIRRMILNKGKWIDIVNLYIDIN